MKIFNTVDQSDLQKASSMAKDVEANGYSGITTFENRHDPFLPLAVCAANTNILELSTGVAIAFLRSPMSTAQIAWDLTNLSKGRFILGLGPQIKAHNEKRFSVPWSPPVPRLREYVNSLRAIWTTWQTGCPLKFAGTHYQFSLMPPNFVPEKSNHRLTPVTLAAVGPKMLSLAGEVADGVQLHPFCTSAYIEKCVLPQLEKGFKKSGMKRENFEISGGGFIVTGANDQEVNEMAEWVRYRIGFYASTPAYWPVLEHSGYGDLGPKLNRLTKEGKWDKLAQNIPDDLLYECAAIGRHEFVVDEIKKRFSGLVDTVQASQSYEKPAKIPSEIVAEIKQIPSPFLAFKNRR